jgi:mono/diheme cytochrome c family protein
VKRHVRYITTVVVLLIVIVAGLGFFVYSGIYNIGADAHHTKPVYAVLQTLRNRSIHVRSEDIKVPNLNDPQLILKGAGQYAAMCTSCHLQPGVENSELRAGMYPQPPNLSKVRLSPQDEFWVIKHGIKMSAMPAWGVNHDDPTIWSMVAFLQKLPDMTPAQYKAMVAIAPPDEDMDMGGMGHMHEHAHGESDHDGREGHQAEPVPAMSTMPGMTQNVQAPARASTAHRH